MAQGIGSLRDFSNHTLWFWKEGKSITLQGVQVKPLDILEGETMRRLPQLKGVEFVAHMVEGAELNNVRAQLEDHLELYTRDLQQVCNNF